MPAAQPMRSLREPRGRGGQRERERMREREREMVARGRRMRPEAKFRRRSLKVFSCTDLHLLHLYYVPPHRASPLPLALCHLGRGWQREDVAPKSLQTPPPPQPAAAMRFSATNKEEGGGNKLNSPLSVQTGAKDGEDPQNGYRN
ncbi:hypothetical protein CRENBAI_017179 [Crenichthys baileyi]|uniref:Uncharacterized protein n=1 Tax=Crenichthys baileyi TaxID=28760 RepID=A0AAV9RQT6_9TELE